MLGATTIAVVHPCGGVGKTTTVVNLATSLSARGFRVLIVDMCPDADATAWVGPSPGIQPNLLHYLTREVDGPPLHETAYPYLHILPAGPELADLGWRGPPSMAPEQLLRVRLRCLTARYDFILIDAPPGLARPTCMALVAADYCLVSTTPERYSRGHMERL